MIHFGAMVIYEIKKLLVVFQNTFISFYTRAKMARTVYDSERRSRPLRILPRLEDIRRVLKENCFLV